MMESGGGNGEAEHEAVVKKMDLLVQSLFGVIREITDS